jgi:hypothetical protein
MSDKNLFPKEYQRGYSEKELEVSELRKEFLKNYIIKFDTQ